MVAFLVAFIVLSFPFCLKWGKKHGFFDCVPDTYGIYHDVPEAEKCRCEFCIHHDKGEIEEKIIWHRKKIRELYGTKWELLKLR